MKTGDCKDGKMKPKKVCEFHGSNVYLTDQAQQIEAIINVLNEDFPNWRFIAYTKPEKELEK